MNLLQKASDKIGRDLRRVIKHSRQHFAPADPGMRPRALFICGSQRSGTNMLKEVLDASVHTRVYNEDHARAFRNFRLRSLDHITALVNKAPCSWVVFKCIMDSQHVLKFMDHFPGSLCIWIYRDYRDVAESAERKWSNAQRHIIRNIAERDNNWDRWYTETLSDELRALIRDLYHPEISELTAGALKWYLRNRLFFEMGLDNNPERVLLVSYNQLVTAKESEFERIGRFLGLDIEPTTFRHVHGKSLQKPLGSQIDQPVKSLCDQLLKDFMRILEESK